MKTSGYSRLSKDLVIKQLEKELKQSATFFVTGHSKVSASSMDKLRAKLRTNNSRYLAVKKSLGRKALENSKIAGIAEKLDGACGFTFASGDVVLSSKTLVDFAKENEAFKIQSGYLNGQLITVERIKTLASLPSREVLLGRVAGGVKAPISRVAGAISGTVRKIVTLVDQLAKKKSS